MSHPARSLVVDDTPAKVKLLVDVLAAKGCEVASATHGAEALAMIAAAPPDLVLLDIMMPGLSGYDVCRRLRAAGCHRAAAGGAVHLVGRHAGACQRHRGWRRRLSHQAGEAGRVACAGESLLRIKTLQDEVHRQTAQLAEWNATLEQRVQDQLAQLDRLGRLKRFFSAPLAEAILAGGDEMIKTHRREISVGFIDLRGFTAFTESAEPEEVMALLHDYHAAIGAIVVAHEGTLQRFAGDSVMVFFNDPLPIARPAEAAVRMALAMQAAFVPLGQAWHKRGFSLGLGCGVAQGYATLGTIGFEGRWDCAAIGNVTNLAARLCGEAAAGQVLVDRKIMARLDTLVDAQAAGPFALKGLAQPVPAFEVRSWVAP